MKLCLISDTHNLLSDIPLSDFDEADVLIHAGDMCSFGATYEVSKFFKELEFIKNSGKIKHFIGIAGNHDRCFESNTEETLKLIPDWYHYLHDSEITIDGVKFYGTPYQPEFFNWAFNLPRGNPLKDVWKKIPSDTDVLITHTPPHGILDLSLYGNEHCGCKDLLNKVKEIEPKIHVFGHIHESHGHKKIGNTDFYNASSLNERYRYIHKPIMVNL